MRAEKFTPEAHYEDICRWSTFRGMEAPPLFLFPKTGRVVPGVLALFVYVTDSAVGFIENMISNPTRPMTETSKAADLCIAAIEQDARELGILFLRGSTRIPSVVKRAKRRGYLVKDETYQLIAKVLR